MRNWIKLTCAGIAIGLVPTVVLSPLNALVFCVCLLVVLFA